MQATQAIIDAMAALLGADTGTLAAGTPFVEVALVKAPFTPGPDLVLADLTLADFDGYAALHAASAATQVFKDPATGENIIQVREPAGGWHWATTGVTNLPQTIHGFALLDPTGATVYGAELLDAPVVLTASGQGVDIPEARFRLNAQPLN